MTTNEALLQGLTDLVPFLRWSIRAPEDGELVGRELADDPDRLAAAVAATGPGRGTGDPQVAASLWWQAYAYRVAGTTLACWALGRAAPDPAAPGTAIAIGRSRPSSVVYDPGAETVGDLDQLVERLFPAHLDLVAASLRTGHSLGDALVRGNVAAGIESALGALAGAPGAPDLGQQLGAVREALPAPMRATIVLGPDGHRRKTCCLWWKTTDADGKLCADCSLG